MGRGQVIKSLLLILLLTGFMLFSGCQNERVERIERVEEFEIRYINSRAEELQLYKNIRRYREFDMIADENIITGWDVNLDGYEDVIILHNGKYWIYITGYRRNLGLKNKWIE